MANFPASEPSIKTRARFRSSDRNRAPAHCGSRRCGRRAQGWTGPLAGLDSSAGPGDHARPPEGASRGPRSGRGTEQRNSRCRHAGVLGVGGLCGAAAPGCRPPTPAEDLLLPVLPRDEADGVRARLARARALRAQPRLPDHALLGRRERHGSGRPRRRLERLCGLRLQRVPARRDRPDAARRLPVLAEGRHRAGGRRLRRADRERRPPGTHGAPLGHALRPRASGSRCSSSRPTWARS